MIISPPFLPDRAGQSEDSWLDTAMAQPASRLASTNAPEGSFPLSLKLAWHNGLHIQAPVAGGAYLPVRAIADGKVVFVHAPTAQNAELDHPLNYNPFRADTPTAAWTSDGFLVIEHRTEIGAEGALPVEIVYYSVHMHLGSIAACPRTGAPWSVGNAVYRKEELGAPGGIYGHGGQIHFEICCNKANLASLTRRGPDWVDPLALPPPVADGRTDSVFGSIYVFLPAGTPTSTSQPTHHLRPTGNVGGGASAASDHFPPNTLRTPLWVQIDYANGGATLATYDAHGEPVGSRRSDGRDDYIRRPSTPSAASRSFEYELCAAAKDRHDALSAADQGASSPSGWYELLRFGRNLGADPLPANAAHWRKIVTSSGEVWADLNAQGTFKFSDADFLAVMGWNCFGDDAAPTDQRCDSPHMKALIRDPDHANAQRMQPAQLARRLGEPDVRKKLRRAICNFPSEWDQRSVEARYGWLETEDFKPTDDDPAGAQKWARFVKHAKALSFLELPAELRDAEWRFHPREFVGHMRRCGWLSAQELAQCFPRRQLHLSGISFSSSTFAWQTAIARANEWMLPFNRATRKYGISTSKQRLLHLFSHVIPETANLSMVKEGGGENAVYSPYYGRGLIQLTHLENYTAYGEFRGFKRTFPAATFPQLGWDPDVLIARDNRGGRNAENCVDSACFYLARRANMLSHMDSGVSQADAITVSKDVNGYVAIENLNGLDARLQSVIYLKYMLLDDLPRGATETVNFTWRRNSRKEAVMDAQGRPVLTGNPPRAAMKYYPVQHTMNISLERQRP
ncbi:M23 family metallopeptidase [Variovorax paradoxus]|uniref:M23 family metallopeptidase n=1 Tax=Variovorax paradoxus TaxID=34073 RepID=UPI0009BBE302|nr:M23 family metallopeptidase [Variovorax paradoxus]